ncbi:MAG: hypothetical protein FJ405_17835 [Verrucomicrobia bacterium]|nr:hypothetical protein [Verrucomicrobiota bacterium]
MSSHFDASEFIDDDLQPSSKSTPPLGYSTSAVGGDRRAPSREETESKVTEMQQRLAELKSEQQRLERERAALEETRRRQAEFATGRVETTQNLTRALTQLEEAEVRHRREAELRSRAVADMREALAKLSALQPDSWNKDNLEVELTRSLAVVDNARMEWNSARARFQELQGEGSPTPSSPNSAPPSGSVPPIPQKFSDLCRLGFAINWPLFVLGLLIFLMLWIRK